MDIQELSEIAFTIIANVGESKSLLIEALQYAKNGEKVKADELLEKAEEKYMVGHHAHLDIVVREARELTPQVSLLMAHAEDQLMSVETVKMLVLEVIEMNGRMLEIEKVIKGNKTC